MSDLFAIVGPLLRALPPETAHYLTIRALVTGLVEITSEPDDPVLATELWGRAIPNPVGLAAGFDKNAQVFGAMARLGFGLIEVGSVTPRPQPGNPKPRLFRLGEDRAVINRMGFNNRGHDYVRGRLAAGHEGPGLLGVNLGANKDSTDRAADYVAGIRALGALADYVVVNVSSPNTPGLRALQGKAELDDLLARVLAQRDETAAEAGKAIPLMLKIAPDLTDDDICDICDVVLARGVDGLIVSNTTIDRPASLRSRHKSEAGGLSGRPLFAPSTALLGAVYRRTGGRVPLIGVGGISSGADAYAKIRAGASAVQLYTALVYEGPGLVGRIKRDLAALLKADGHERVTDAVGVGSG